MQAPTSPNPDYKPDEEDHFDTTNDLINQLPFFIMPTELTPIPEVSEYSPWSSTRTSTTDQWGSEDLSPRGSVENRAVAARLLYRLQNQQHQSTNGSPLLVPSDPAQRHSISPDVECDPDSLRGSISETSATDSSGAHRLKLSHSRSSIRDFLQLENLLAETSEDEQSILSGPIDPSFLDLVASIQALQQRHVDDLAGSESVDTSSSSNYADRLGSRKADTLVGEKTRTLTEFTVSQNAPLMTAESISTSPTSSYNGLSETGQSSVRSVDQF